MSYKVLIFEDGILGRRYSFDGESFDEFKDRIISECDMPALEFFKYSDELHEYSKVEHEEVQNKT